jgi:hypothetical protein
MENGSHAIVLRDVVKSLDGRRVLNGVSLAAPVGRITVLMGPRAWARRSPSSTSLV